MENVAFFEYTRKNRRRSQWRKFVQVMACVVVFCTTYALILPALTMESQTWCGYEEHIHEETCIVQLNSAIDAQLSCELGALGVHAHTAACQDASGVLACGLADYVIHTHNALCQDASGNLVCTLPEVAAHSHRDTCYVLPETKAHEHDASCYEVSRGVLECELEEKTGHTHETVCYGEEGILVCGTETHSAHFHTDDCYKVETSYACGLESHPHADSCYTARTLSCEIAEHDHSDDCYTEPVKICDLESHPHTSSCCKESKTLICGQKETEGHTHSDACYTYPLVCQLEEEEGHRHSDECYEQIENLVCNQAVAADTAGTVEPVLSCGKDEVGVHTHSEACLDATGKFACGMLQTQEHIHTDACITEAQELPLTCALEENEEHQHNEKCYGTWGYDCGMEEHAHTLACFSDPEADTETAEVWARMFENTELTGSFADDLAAIAKTQLGYTESENNYQVLDDGVTMKGYTRYGAWAGSPYADWNTLFVAFCMDYANVPEEVFPTASTAEQWVEELSDSYYDLYYAADSGYEPKIGDVAFLHIAESENETEEEKKIPNFMGIILECKDTELTIAAGDSSNMVEKVKVSLTDPSLLGYGEVFAMPALTETLEENPYDLGAVVTVNCLNSRNQSTDTYSGLEPFELRISYYTNMEADQHYTMTLDANFEVESVASQWGDCPFAYSEETRTITFSPAISQAYGGELTIKGRIASHSSEESVKVNPVAGNSKTVTITKDPEQLQYTDSHGDFTVKVDLLEPSAGSMSTVNGIKLTPVQPTETIYEAMTNGESRTLGSDRVYERQMFNIQFVDASGNVVTGLDLSSRNITLTVTGTDTLKGMENEGSAVHAFYRMGNAVNEMTTTQENAAVYEISGGALTDNAFTLDFVSTNPNELAAGSYGNATFAYNDMRDAFIYDPQYSQFYNQNSPLGTAGSFHLVGFGDVYTNAHTNGNILAYNLYAYNNFGTNQKDGYDGFTELHYVQNYKYINSTSSARNNDILVIGSDHTVDVMNGNEFVINDSKIGRPKNLIQDDDSNSAPFIDLHRVESEIRAISANLGSYETIESREYLEEHKKAPEEFIIANVKNSNGKYGPEYDKDGDPDFKKNHESDDPYLEILDKDNIGVWKATPAEIKAIADTGRGLDMKGFESGGSGAIIVNVDMSQWPADQILELPEARVYVDGKAESVSETLDFSAGKVIWNFTNADGKQIKTNIMTGMVVAPGATVTISQNLNGTVVAENIDVRAESHRTDFVGKIYKNEFLESAHIHVHKVDKGNFGNLLEGAEFQLYEYTGTGENDGWIPAISYTYDEDGKITETSTELKGATDASGVLLLNGLKYNTVYKLVETKAPAGYQLDSTERYLYYEKTDEGVTQGPKPSDFESLNFINSSVDGDCVHYHFTNTEQDVEKTSISVKKNWDLGDSGLGEAPVDLVYFHVYQTATTVTGAEKPDVVESWYGMYPVTKANGWQTTIVNLPKISADEKTTYTYSVKEVSVPGFITTYSENNTNGVNSSDNQIVIINTINPNIDYVDLSVHKAWVDSSGATITDPGFTKIGFSLYQVSSSDEQGANHSVPVLLGHYTLTAENEWSWEIKNLISVDVVDSKNVYYFYYVEEDPVEGYTPTYRGDLVVDSGAVAPVADQLVLGKENLTITNTKDPSTSVTLEKKWYDEVKDAENNPVEISAPVSQITVQLQRMTRFMNDWENYGDPITVTESDGWQYTISELPMYDNSVNADGTRNVYYYRFVETEVDGFDAGYTIIHPQNPGYEVNAEIDGIGNGGKVVISNTKRETTSLTIQKSWKDAAGGELTEIDTESITVHIYRQLGDDVSTREKYKTVAITPNENGSWAYTQTDLPKANSEGKLYVYTVEEEAIAGYVTSYKAVQDENGVLTGYEITNQQRTGYTSIQVDKEWVMLDGSTTPPEGTTVTFDLIQRSKPAGWTGDYLDTSTVDPVTVQYTVNGVTHSVEGYPGETVNLILHWEKVNTWDDIQYANPNASVSYQNGNLTYRRTDETDTGANFVIPVSIVDGITPDWQGNRIITVETGIWSWDQWSFVDLQLIPTARETVIGTYTIPNDENGDKWSFKKIGLPASQEIGGVTIDYTYFVEEHPVPGYTTSYDNNGGITGGTITMTNTERQNKTYLSIHKEWVGVTDQTTLPENIQVDVWQIAVPEGQSVGDSAIDTSLDPVTVRYTFNNVTYSVQGYPGQKVGYEVTWTKQNTGEDSQYATVEATYSWSDGSNGISDSVNVERAYVSDDIVRFAVLLTIPENVAAVNGERTVDVAVSLSFNASPAYWTVAVMDSIQYTKYGTYTLSAADDWNLVLNDLPLISEDSSGKIMNYSYFVDEIVVPGFTVSYAGNDTKNGVTNAEVTITNTEKENKTSITVSKKWTNGVEDVTDNAVKPIEFYLYQVANNPAEEETAITVTNNLPNQQTNQLTAKPGDKVKITLSWTATEDNSTDMNNFDPALRYYVGAISWDSTPVQTTATVDGRNAVFTAELNINEMMSSGATIEYGNSYAYGGTWTSNIELLEASPYSGPHILQPGAWSMTFDSLPKEAEDEAGNVITYSYYVKEVNGEQYSVTYTDASGNAVSSDAPVQSGTVIITNTDKTITMPLTVTKKWFKADGTPFTKGTGEIQFNLHQIASTTTGGSAKMVPVRNDIRITDWSDTKWEKLEIDSAYPVGTKLTLRIYCNWGVTTNKICINNAEFAGEAINNNSKTLFTVDLGTVTDGEEITITGYIGEPDCNTYWTGEVIPDISDVVTTPSETTRTDTVYKANEVLSNSNNWTEEYTELPLEGTDTSGNKVTYTYYVKEIPMDGYETTYEGNDTINGITSGSITIKNTVSSEGGYELPATGGIGTTPYTLSGMAMLLCGAVLFLLKRRQIL